LVISEGEKRIETIPETIMTENFYKLMSNTKPTDLGSSKNIKEDKGQKILYLGALFSNYRKAKIGLLGVVL
jgi:hypothetical protein